MPSKRVSLKGKGADLFFGDYAPDKAAAAAEKVTDGGSSPTDTDTAPVVTVEPPSSPLPLSSAAPLSPSDRFRSTETSGAPRNPDTSRRASKLASQIALPTDTVDTIRKVVKVPGKEVSFTRLTPEEKAQIADIVYAYKRRGQKTTENEINRIALNLLLHDYHEHGDASVLARVLAALLA